MKSDNGKVVRLPLRRKLPTPPKEIIALMKVVRRSSPLAYSRALEHLSVKYSVVCFQEYVRVSQVTWEPEPPRRDRDCGKVIHLIRNGKPLREALNEVLK